MSRLLNAAEYDMEAVALEWKYADFLEQQKLCRIDHTLSFCYVILQEAGGSEPDRRVSVRFDGPAEMSIVAHIFGEGAAAA